MPNQDIRTRDCILLVEAGEVASYAGNAWVRPATQEEATTWREELERPYTSAITGELVPGRSDIDDLFTFDGRKYELVVITREAPLKVWLRASGHLRMRTMYEEY